MWPGRARNEADDRELSPEEEEAFRAGLDRVAEEKRRALLDPGPSWREWFFFDAMKWLVGMFYLIGDSWILASWVHNGMLSPVTVAGLAASLVAAVYLEVLFWRYLWSRPSDNAPHRVGPFRPSWRALNQLGRWTPEAFDVRAGRRRPVPEDGAPDVHEFL